jgi:sugar/nucleoside kinase (ribokinase family)
MPKINDVIGIGNTLMDFLVEVDDSHLKEFNLRKGEMHLVEEAVAQNLLQKISQKNLSVEFVPGGSAANTIRGLAFLGSKTILCGKVGQDANGTSYIRQMQKHHVLTNISQDQKRITGHAITFITPDAQRTFSVHLGAALYLDQKDIIEKDIQNSSVLHLEGYQLEGRTKELILYSMELARKHNTLISLDLADPGVIRRNKLFLQRIVQDYVDILFLNEKEAQEFTGKEEEQAALELSSQVKIAIVKIGDKGSLISSEGTVHYINPFPAQAIDTTGAGDTYAAGFLYGYCQGWPLEQCGRLGSLFASKVVEQKGTKILHLDAERMKRSISADNSH